MFSSPGEEAQSDNPDTTSQRHHAASANEPPYCSTRKTRFPARLLVRDCNVGKSPKKQADFASHLGPAPHSQLQAAQATPVEPSSGFRPAAVGASPGDSHLAEGFLRPTAAETHPGEQYC